MQTTLSLINCTIYHFKELFDQSNLSLPICGSKESAENTYRVQTDYFSKLVPDDVPCSQISYKYEIDYQSQNSYYDLNSSENNNYTFFDLLTFYYKLETEEKTETLLYDAVNFLSAAGGNLGLFIGFSCLSVMLTMIDLISDYIKKFIC